MGQQHLHDCLRATATKQILLFQTVRSNEEIELHHSTLIVNCSLSPNDKEICCVYIDTGGNRAFPVRYATVESALLPLA